MQLGLTMLVAVVLFAWIKGGPGERVGSAAIAMAWIGSLAVEVLAPRDARATILLFFDFALAAALLATAIRYASFWLGATMMLQAFVLAVHALHQEDGLREAGLNNAYIVALNLSSYGLLLAVAISTTTKWMARRKAAGSASPPAHSPAMAHPV